ncbi:MAG: hypothetical protein GQ559_03925 [Desulfobulbaceae bacterium]|nr:hypothetical protein [Desulfobulbaceae bacterium]
MYSVRERNWLLEFSGLYTDKEDIRMKRKVVAAGLFCVLVNWFGAVAMAEVQQLPLTEQDCLKCHIEEVMVVAGQESAHKSEIGCLDCHETHPPEGEAVIPECSSCHDSGDNPHFGLKNCTQCHPPHAPLVTDFGGIEQGRTVCVSCHEDIDNQLTALPSAHGEQDCTECHNEHGLAEGQYQTCLDCHEKHAPEMEIKDCLVCHKPHQPTGYSWDTAMDDKLCATCHEETVQDYTDNGGAHLDNLACVECHTKHPPREEGVIPSCADCHDPGENEHFATGQCQQCHNPHSPRKIDFGSIENLRTVCLGCHPKPGEQMKRFPSSHAELECNECHPTHGERLDCLNCHDGHSSDMQYGDCLKCHQHHAPAPTKLGKNVPSRLCGGCHQEQNVSQQADTSKHGKLQCVYCHKGQHKVIHECRTCHGEPHDAPLHRRFKDCHKCHGNPHNLKKK